MTTDAQQEHLIGIDVGGTGIKGAPVDVATGQLLQLRTRLLTPQPATPASVAETVVALLDQIALPGPVGITLPAVVLDGVVQTASNIDEGWIGTDAGQLFGAATGRTVGVVNDADAAGIAEIRFGAGRDRKGVIVVITLGTGIGERGVRRRGPCPQHRARPPARCTTRRRRTGRPSPFGRPTTCRGRTGRTGSRSTSPWWSGCSGPSSSSSVVA